VRHFWRLHVLTIDAVARRLADLGYTVGQRLFEYLKWREKATVRETRLERQLLYISSTIWKALFGREATLSRSKENEKCAAKKKSNFFGDAKSIST
jgi:hypothetical protein